MNSLNQKNLMIKLGGVIGAAGASVLLSLPALAAVSVPSASSSVQPSHTGELLLSQNSGGAGGGAGGTGSSGDGGLQREISKDSSNPNPSPAPVNGGSSRNQDRREMLNHSGSNNAGGTNSSTMNGSGSMSGSDNMNTNDSGAARNSQNYKEPGGAGTMGSGAGGTGTGTR